MQPYKQSNPAITMTRLRSDYYNEPPYSLAAMEVLLLKLHLLLVTTCLLGKCHKTTQAGCRSDTSKPLVK